MKKIFLLSFIIFAQLTYAQLKINELMTNNVSAVWDDAYNFSMWVELYNPGTTQVNQSLYYFTDDLKFPRKWQPAAVWVPAKAYQTLWFEKPDRSGHANFKLNPEGGTLYMLTSSGAIVDYVVYPAQSRNISYGRKTDGGEVWVFFEEHSKGFSNNGKASASERCVTPELTVKGGYFANGINIKFVNPAPGDTIYYNLSSAEPTKTSSTRYTPGNTISITSSSIIRAKAYGAHKLSSAVTTGTFFIGQRDYNLPIVSIVTPQAYLTDNLVGIYVTGTNGIPGNGVNTPANFNQDWDRPANFELIDTNNVVRLNQELDIQIGGGWSRSINPQKSLHIQPKKKFNNNKLDYDIFAASKPDKKYKDIFLRNSGNDFAYSMLRDGYMQSIVLNRMDVDAVAYEPAVCFMNGVYYGIQNLRERTNADYIYTNYGYDEEEIIILDQLEIPTNAEYLQMLNFITNNDISNATIYNQLCEMMDVDSYINYMMTQIFMGNYDWPHNNIKMWKKIDGGKWRWILFDLDFGFNLYETNLHSFNSLTYALGEASSKSTQAWATALFSRLVVNPTFQKKLIDRFSIHLSTTFETNRMNHILDSLAIKITNEINFHKSKWGGSARAFGTDIGVMKGFSANRANNMYSFISSRFMSGAVTQEAEISSNIPNASYLMNGELIKDANLKLKSFKGRAHEFTANPVKGYDFKYWELLNQGSMAITPVGYGSVWKYWDMNGVPATNWNATTYSDSGWKTGTAQLGYGGKGEITTIGYGGNASVKYPTAYFRKTINIENPAELSNIQLSIFVDDGGVAYVNGTEVGRYNMPTGEITFNTYSTTYNNGEYATFNVPVSLLISGANVIAVEVHQTNANSSDLIFNAQLTAESFSNNLKVTNPSYSTNLNSNIQLKAVYEENSTPDPVLSATVVINEIVASNSVISDENGEKDDYIELYNYGSEPVNVAGWYLTDTPSNPRLVQIPVTDSAKTVIQPKGFLIIWTDDAPQQGVRHVKFKLSKDGETLMLSCDDKFGTTHTIDSVAFPYMEQNMSYARFPDGSSTWVIQPPTYNSTNLSTVDLTENISGVNVYPTNIIDRVNISNAEGKQVRITDIAGKVLYNNQMLSANETISLDWLQQGMYLIVVDEETFRVIKK